MTTATTTPSARRHSDATGGLAALLTAAAILIPPAMAAPVIDALRAGVLTLGDGPVARAIPESFYGPAVLPELLVHNTGWVVALGTAAMVAVIVLLHRTQRQGR